MEKGRNCLECGKKLTIKSEAVQYVKKKDSKAIYKYNRQYHKECWSKVQSVYLMIKRANHNPDNYMTCNDCDSIFTKTKRGRYLKLKTNCPKCNSANIERF